MCVSRFQEKHRALDRPYCVHSGLQDLTLRFYRPTGVVLSSVRHYNPRRVVPKKIRSGCYKVSNNKNVELTYEMAQGPCKLGVTKSWLSWNTSELAPQCGSFTNVLKASFRLARA